MTETITGLTQDQARAAQAIDAMDLEPITYKLMHPEPGETALSLADADQRTAAYRCFLKLCAWYPGESLVPSKPIDEVWHAHQLDSPKYAPDCDAVFGYFLHHFPYFGLRGADDEAALQAAYARTRELFRRHFGARPLPGEASRSCSSSCDSGSNQCSGSGCHVNAQHGPADCQDGSLCVPEGTKCDKSAETTNRVRPRPDRSGTD